MCDRALRLVHVEEGDVGPQPRRHCTVSTEDVAFCSDNGAVIGAAPAGADSDQVLAANRATAQSLADMFMANSP